MMRNLLLVIFLLALLAPLASAKDKEQVYVLIKPDPEEEEERTIYENSNWGIEFDLRDGFTFTEEEIEEGTLNLTIQLDGFPLMGAITAEELDGSLTAAGYWRQMLNSDPGLENLIVYERKTEIADSPAIQVRFEGGEGDGYFVILSMVFTSEQKGYTISVFCDGFFFDQVSDFMEEISEGMSFIEEEVVEPDDEAVETTDEAIDDTVQPEE